ncbi:MAG: hypothetical protein IT368_13430 [Candidatus Hydrogenedentes bacterium]|nr:hypothetical protein [Candidatus Hydrogenedentota bacterium]
MIELACPNCGELLSIPDQYAGQSGACRKCGSRIQVPEKLPPLAQGGGSGFHDFAGLGEHTHGEVEQFGAYGKAADSLWEDPSAKVAARQAGEQVRLPEVPAEILEKHRKNIARRNRNIAMLGGLLLVFVVLVAMAYLMANSARNSARSAPGALPGAQAPAAPAQK